MVIIKQYKTIAKTIESKQLEKCICDRCGKVIQIDSSWDSLQNDYSDIEIRNYFISNDWMTGCLYYQLCSDCVLELLDFFKMTDKETVAEIKEDISLWRND